jgi:hypothetical protein
VLGKVLPQHALVSTLRLTPSLVSTAAAPPCRHVSQDSRTRKLKC